MLGTLALLSAFLQQPAFDPHAVTSYGVVYKVPAMEQVHVVPDVPYKTVAGGSLKMDLYYPPGHTKGKAKLPVVIFFNGGIDQVGVTNQAGARRWAQYTSWPRLMAAHGFASLFFDARGSEAQADIDDAMKAIRDRANEWDLDADNIGIWACSGNTVRAMPWAMGEARPGLKCMVVYYGGVDVPTIRQDLPFLMVKAAKDYPQIISTVNTVTAKAVAQNAPWTVLVVPGAHHAFDALDDNDTTRKAIKQTIDFFDLHLRIKQAPSNPTPEQVALSYFFGQEWDKAAEAYRNLMAIRPDDAVPEYRLGISLMQIRDYENALKHLQGAIARKNDFPDANLRLGQVFNAMRRYEDAERHFEAQIAVDPRNNLALMSAASAEINLKKYAEAIDHLERSLGVFPSPVAAYNLGCAFALSGQKDKAISALERAVQLGYRNRAEMESDDDLASLRSKERFKALLARIAG